MARSTAITRGIEPTERLLDAFDNVVEFSRSYSKLSG
jgi:hypothetical protein